MIIIGYCSSNESLNNDVTSPNDKVLATESTEESPKEKTEGKDFTDADIKIAVEEMYKELFQSNDYINFDEKYTSAEYKSLYKKAESLADDMFLFVDHWTNGQDSDNPSVKSISVRKNSDNEATANVALKLYKDSETINYVKLALLFEGGKWIVDDFLINDEGEDYSEKAYLRQFIKEAQSKPKEDYSWLQGHWVYEQGNYKGHFIIQGNTITQYSSMNPEHYDATYRIEDNEIKARLVDGLDLTVKIDFANQRIDYGDGNWMHKVE